MKNKLHTIRFLFISFLTLGMFSSQVQSQNMILAGQSEGEYIHYTDYEPDSSVVLTTLINNFDLDIDQDGVIDLGFYVQAGDAYVGIKFWTSVVIYNNQLDLVRADGSNARELAYGDTINSGMLWGGDSISSLILRGYYHYWEPEPWDDYYYGVFESGYLGFKIAYPAETYYGWVKIDADAGMGIAEIIAYSSAFYSRTVGVHEESSIHESLNIFPNPSNGQFTIKMTQMGNKARNYQIFNSYGKMVMSGGFYGSDAHIDARNLYPGIYVVEVAEGSQNSIRKKIMIQ